MSKKGFISSKKEIIKNQYQKQDLMQGINTDTEARQFQGNYFLLALLLIVMLISSILIFVFNKDKFIPEKDNTVYYELDLTKMNNKFDGFICYEGDLYILQPSLEIIDESYVGELIGVTNNKILHPDIKEKDSIRVENLDCYAVEQGFEVRKTSLGEDYLLVYNEGSINKYDIYLKNKSESEYKFRNLYNMYQYPNEIDSLTFYNAKTGKKYDELTFTINDIVLSDKSYNINLSHGSFVQLIVAIEADNKISLITAYCSIYEDRIIFDPATGYYTDEDLENIKSSYIIEIEGIGKIIEQQY